MPLISNRPLKTAERQHPKSERPVCVTQIGSLGDIWSWLDSGGSVLLTNEAAQQLLSPGGAPLQGQAVGGQHRFRPPNVISAASKDSARQ